MAKAKSQNATVAVALRDIQSHRVRAGQVIKGDGLLIAALSAEGAADTAESAIAYAIEQGAESVDLAAVG